MNILKRAKSVNTKEKSISNDNFILGKDETLLPKFTRIFGTKYAVNVYYLRVQKPELNLTDSCINIYLPMSFRNRHNQDVLDVILLKMYTAIAEKEIENIMEKARHTFGFAPEDYEIKKMNSILAHFDQNSQSILINPYIVMYAKEIVEYVIFHQFCHLKYKTHCQKFNDLIKKHMPNYKQYEERLKNVKY